MKEARNRYGLNPLLQVYSFILDSRTKKIKDTIKSLNPLLQVYSFIPDPSHATMLAGVYRLNPLLQVYSFIPSQCEIFSHLALPS